MASVEPLLSIEHVEGALGLLLLVALSTIIDRIVEAVLNRKVFAPAWSWGKRKYKTMLTKRKKITADYEFSIYLDSNLPADAPREAATNIMDDVAVESNGDFEIIEQKWGDDGRELDVKTKYKNRTEPYELTLNFIPGTSQSMETGFDPSIRSIGVSITFRFEFGKLRNSIIDLMLFARFLRAAAESTLPVKSITDGRFVVSPIDNDLTLDDWIKQDKFDVSLLLNSEDGRSSVEFYSDKAVISSPHTDVDDKTVEYIRATLLSYYL